VVRISCNPVCTVKYRLAEALAKLTLQDAFGAVYVSIETEKPQTRTEIAPSGRLDSAPPAEHVRSQGTGFDASWSRCSERGCMTPWTRTSKASSFCWTTLSGIHPPTHPSIHSSIHTHTCMHAYIYAYIPAYIHTYIQFLKYRTWLKLTSCCCLFFCLLAFLLAFLSLI
jgi:hypothetical protein